MPVGRDLPTRRVANPDYPGPEPVRNLQLARRRSRRPWIFLLYHRRRPFRERYPS